MKFPKLSSLLTLGKKKETKEVLMKVTSEGLQSEDNASLEAAEKALADRDDEVTQLKEADTTRKGKISTLEANVTELTSQVKSIQEENTKVVAGLNEKITAQEKENKELSEKLAKSAAAQPHVVVPDPNKEGAVAADPLKVKETMEQYKTSVDVQAEEIKKNNQAQTQIK